MSMKRVKIFKSRSVGRSTDSEYKNYAATVSFTREELEEIRRDPAAWIESRYREKWREADEALRDEWVRRLYEDGRGKG